jgi:hypothetical protein
MTTTDPLSQTLSALADPTRRAILARLSKGAATVNELAEPFDITLQAVSKHLKVLERAAGHASGPYHVGAIDISTESEVVATTHNFGAISAFTTDATNVYFAIPSSRCLHSRTLGAVNVTTKYPVVITDNTRNQTAIYTVYGYVSKLQAIKNFTRFRTGFF